MVIAYDMHDVAPGRALPFSMGTRRPDAEAPAITGGEIIGTSRLSSPLPFGIVRWWGDLAPQTAVSRDTHDDASSAGASICVAAGGLQGWKPKLAIVGRSSVWSLLRTNCS